jgi:hypothetical protein
MIYFKYLRELSMFSNPVSVICRDENGVEWWLGEGEQDAGYLAWVAEGNEAMEWNPEETA